VSNVYICGAEGLTLPAAADGVSGDFNAFRWNQLNDWLAAELRALFNTNFITNLAYDPTTALANFFAGIWGNVIPVSPNVIQHPNIVISQVAISGAITTFAANMIIDLSGGVSGAATAVLAAEILTLQNQALASGVLWRDASNIGPIPLSLMTSGMISGVAIASGLHHP